MSAVQSVRRTFLGPAAREERGMRVLDGIAVVGVAIGLFTVSWDRLANVTLGGYNVKLPALVFSLAVLAALPMLWRRRAELRRPWVKAVAVLVVAMLLVLVVSAVLSARPAAGFAQIVAVVTGAVAPAVAVFAVVRAQTDLLWALRWFLAGAALASAFGLYQLAAFYAGWPQFISYTGVGVDGGAGRIAAFNYEPAYFANFVILALGAAITLAVLQGRRLGWLPVFGFAIVLVLVNVRALFFVLPVFVVLLAIRWRQNRRVLLRLLIAGVLVTAADLATTALIENVTAQAIQQTQAQPQSQAPVAESTPPPVPEPDPTAQADSPVNVLNPNEQSSNAPRLALYKAVLEVSMQRPVLGVGPGNLASALQGVGYVAPNQGTQVVANNIWLQALADGGILLVLIEAALAVLLILGFFRRGASAVQPLVAALLTVIGVSGMLTSYFFDVKVWVVLGLVVAAVVLSDGTVPGRHRRVASDS